MKCSKCQFENPADTQFCGRCGERLLPPEDISLPPTLTLQEPKKELTRGAIFAERYEVMEELGKGGMGKVYRVLDNKIDEEVALKLIRPEIASDIKTLERFGNELKTARKISHRNVCRMYHLSEEEGTYYITMEYVPGQDLRSMIKMTKQLSVGTAVSVAKEVSEGLAEAHKLGIVHRDLKPSNIMIDKEGRARIMDFGIARSMRTRGETGVGVLVGTPEYMSPEQAETKDVDQRSDIYSLGVILFEMLTGRLPFEGDTPLGIAMKHKTEKPPNPRDLNPQIPEDINRMIKKCMEKEREKRYQSAEELLSELDKLEKDFPMTERLVRKKKPVTTKEITVTFEPKKLLLPALVLIVVIAAGVILWNILSQEELTAMTSNKPSVAVMYFKNNTGDDSLDHWRSALSDLLITDLSQSKFIRVLSAERLFNILRQLNQLDARSYSSEVLREVAKKTGVENVLVGNFTKAEENFRIDVTIQDANTGEMFSSERVEGKGERDFYNMVDELTRRIKASLELTEEQISNDIDSQIIDITTSSPEAYKYYSEGRKLHLQADYMRSLGFMQKALAIDPEFAMAHRSVAMAFHNMSMIPAKKKAIKKAFELSYRVSDRERLTIAGDYFGTSEKTYDKAIDAYKKLLELYPEDTIGNTNLGGLYCRIEEWDKATELFETNVRNQPEGFISYWNLADTYMVKSLHKEAKEILETLLRRHPDDFQTHTKLAVMYICLGEYDEALAIINRAPSKEIDHESDTTKLRGDVHLLAGDFTRAEEEYGKFARGNIRNRVTMALFFIMQGRFGDAIDQCEMRPVLDDLLARAYLKSGNPDMALEKLDKLLKDAVKDESLSRQILILHYQGLAHIALKSIAEAEGIAEKIQDLVEEGLNKKAIKYFHHLKGMIELEEKNFPKAIEHFQAAISLLYFSYDYRRFFHPLFIESLAKAHYGSGNLDKARKEFERITSMTLTRLEDGDIYAKSYYMLGRIFEEKGKRKDARKHYETFLNLWKNADPRIPEVADAQRRYAALTR